MRVRPASVLLLATLVMLVPPSTALGGSGGGHVPHAVDAPPAQWSWPTTPQRIVRAFQAPADAFAAGHRGIDLAAEPGTRVHAPAAGVIAFDGIVVDRSVVTIEHGGGYVTTLEPVVSALPRGTTVRAGDVVGVVDSGGHSPTGSLHFGIRLHGEYINPMLVLDEVPRAVLLPCC